MDIGIHLLGDPWGFNKLTREQRIDIMAYWQVRHGSSDARLLLSGAATPQDLYTVARDLYSRRKGSSEPGARRGVGKRPAAAPTLSQAATKAHWTRRTGSTSDAIAWALTKD